MIFTILVNPFLVVVLVCSSMLANFVSGHIYPYPKTHVWIHNKGSTHHALQLHCWSGDDDLGYHLLTFDTDYEFTFHPNLIGTTKYECSVLFDGYNISSFMAYDFQRDWEGCQKRCTWYLNETNPCQFDGSASRCYNYK